MVMARPARNATTIYSLQMTKQYFGPINKRLIFAADLPDFEANTRILDQISDFVDVIKLSSPQVYEYGAKIVERFTERYNLPVFADIKVADVPHTDAKIVDLMRRVGASAVMVHGYLGPDALDACIDASRGELGIIVQLELTSPGGKLFSARIADEVAKVAATLPIYGMQAPGNRPDRIAAIREIVGPTPIIVCCGVGAQGGTLSQVVASGGDYAIVGRAIYESPSPREATIAVLNK